MRLYKRVILVVLAVAVSLSIILISLQRAQAAHGPAPILPALPGPFGGKIHDITNCHVDFVSYAKKIDVGPPKGGTSFMVVGGITKIIDIIPGVGISSNVYNNENVDEGNWVLGLSSVIPIPCKQCIGIPFVGIKCIDKGFGWYVSKIGTQ